MDENSERNIRNDEKLKFIREDVRDIKQMLKEHIAAESESAERIDALHRQDISAIYAKISALDKKFSLKWVEKLVYFLIAGAALSFISYIAASINSL